MTLAFTSFLAQGDVDNATSFHDKYILNYASWALSVRSVYIKNTKDINELAVLRCHNITKTELVDDILTASITPLAIFQIDPDKNDTLFYPSADIIHKLTTSSDRIIFSLVSLDNETITEISGKDMTVHASLIRI